MNVELSADLKRTLVKKAEEILNGARNSRSFQNQTAQLRNMMQIAQAESEIPVLRNFIRYQAGRKATREFWSLIEEQVIEVLENVIGTDPDLQEPLKRRLAIQSFFGFMVRHYVYLTAT